MAAQAVDTAARVSGRNGEVVLLSYVPEKVSAQRQLPSCSPLVQACMCMWQVQQILFN